jgi:hypothetical protein
MSIYACLMTQKKPVGPVCLVRIGWNSFRFLELGCLAHLGIEARNWIQFHPAEFVGSVRFRPKILEMLKIGPIPSRSRHPAVPHLLAR